LARDQADAPPFLFIPPPENPTDYQEVYIYPTSPLNPDTDGDSVADGKGTLR